MMNGIFDTAEYVPVVIKNNEHPAYVYGILPQSHTQAGYKMDDYVYSSVMGNSAEMLGFPHQTAVLSTEQGQSFRQDGVTATTPPSAKWIVYSTATPTLSSHTCFIRCPTLTHQSLNMAKELPSKILYHIPRFSNSGKEYGNLFYEPHEKTYLALKNTEELKLNEIKLDIVNTDETIAEDLAGQTTIVLHFRKSRM